MSLVQPVLPIAAEDLSKDDQALLARRARVLGPAYRLFYDEPLHIVRGEGVWLYDAQGRRYLDAYNNVASVGHCNPVVVEAIARQAATLNTHTRYLGSQIVDYAEALLGQLGGDFSTDGQVMFTCTGSESNDLALRIARAATGGAGVIVTRYAYHGVTTSIAEISPSLGVDNPLGGNTWTVPAPVSPASGGDVGTRFAADVEQALADMTAKGVRPAALLVDTIFSSDGVYADPAGFLAPAIALVRAAGGLFIADEVQAGFARTGNAMWGFARHGLSPDMVTMGKPMANGHPVGAVAARSALTAAFAVKVRYFNTFGGNPVSAAAAMAVLGVINSQGLAANSQSVGDHLAKGLAALRARYRLIKDVRHAGLFVGVELADSDGQPAPAQAAAIVNHMRQAGVLISATGPSGDTLKIRPPLVTTHDQANLIIAAVDEALSVHQ